MQVWLNGKFVDRDAAAVSVFDAGFQYAIGLFETMLARNGRIFRASAHLERLRSSASSLMLTERLHVDPLIEALHLALSRNELSHARVRLTITGGNLGAVPMSGHARQDPTILIVAQPPTQYPPAFFERGVNVIVSDSRVNPLDQFAGHKVLNYWPRIWMLQQATAKQAGEALWFSVSNHLASGSVSNVFLIRDGRLLTPIARGEEAPGALAAPVLPGVTRRAVLEIASEEGMEIERRMLAVDDLLKADEVFLTNSSWGVLPVVKAEAQPIADGSPGELTNHLRSAWQALVERETTNGSGDGVS